MATANVLIALLVAGVLAQRPGEKGGWLWLAAVLAYFASGRQPVSPPAQGRRARSARSPSAAPSFTPACSGRSGARPAFFFDGGQADQLLIACVAVGMLSGGGAGAGYPPGAVAYSIPLGFGSLIGLLHGGHGPTHLVLVPLLFIYFLVIVLAALAHSRQFARRVVAQAFAESAARPIPDRPAEPHGFQHRTAEAHRRASSATARNSRCSTSTSTISKAVNDPARASGRRPIAAADGGPPRRPAARTGDICAGSAAMNSCCWRAG